MKILNLVAECFSDFFAGAKHSNKDHKNFMKLMQWGSYSEVTNDLNKNR